MLGARTDRLACFDDMLPAFRLCQTRRRLLENGMELYELARIPTLSGRAGHCFPASRAALHAKAMAFDGEAVFISSFILDRALP